VGIDTVAVGEAYQGVSEPSVWVDGVQFGSFEERGDDRPVVAAIVGVTKSAFSRLTVSGRMLRSTVSDSSPTRTSSRKRQQLSISK
jgi:hypothetical protein